MMTRLIQRTARRLLSAGVLSFCGLTIASAPAAEIDAGKARLEAIKVELALLNDSNAYSQPLSVRVRDEGIEVQGTVASEAVRRRILEIARRNCYLPVLDQVNVAGSASEQSAPLMKAAHDRLVRELGAQADAIAIRAESGKLRLTGRVRSVEDKLHASRTLCGLRGCTGLLNELEVKSPDAAPSFTLITHATEEAPAGPAGPIATLPSGLPTVREREHQPQAMPRKKPAPVEEPQLAPVTALEMAPATPAPSQGLNGWPPAHRTLPATPLPAGALFQSHPLSELTRTQATTMSHAPAPTPPVSHAVAPKPMSVTPVSHAVAVPKSIVQTTAATKSAMDELLLHKVKAASGSYARDVRIETNADGVIAVHVSTTLGVADKLTTKLFEVPELSRGNVQLHVHLVR